MSTIDSARQPHSDNLLRALIEEARQRARRRRRAYGGVVLAVALVGAIVFATLQGPSRSGSGSRAALAGPGSPASATPGSGAMPAEHAANGLFYCQGKLGTMRIFLRIGSSGGTYWKLWGYHLARGSGQGVAIGRLKGRWYARLSGSVTPRGGPKQRVLIKLKGRGKGTFVFIPAQPGVLKRDSGTYWSRFIG